MSVKDLKVGSLIQFKGYDEQVPEDERFLEANAQYPVAEIDAKENKVSVEIDNPSFNAKVKESDKNPKKILVEVFEEEFDVVEAPKPAARTAAKPAAAAKAAPAPRVQPTGTKPGGAKAVAKPVAKAAPAPAEEEPQEEEPEVEALEQEDGDILKMVEEAGEGLIDLAKEVAAESASTDYRLGGILYHVHLSGQYKALDEKYNEKGGYGLFVKEQLNVEYRKAMYLEKIYIAFNKYGLDGAKVAEIGWAKASKIAEVMTDETAQELLQLAETNTLADLNENIKASYKTVGGEKGERKKIIAFRFRLFEDSGEVCRAALEGCAASMGFTGSKALDQAFEHIVTEWATEHPVSAPAKATTGRKVAAPAAKAAPKAAAKPAAAARPVARPAARPAAAARA